MDGPNYRQIFRPALSRRRLMGGTALGAIGLAAIAAGCSSTASKKRAPAGQGAASGASAGAGAASSPAAKQPRRGGTINVARLSSQVDRNFDPYVNSSVRDQCLRFIYQGLLGYDPISLAIEPEIAQKWEQPDQTTYVFHLQPGVKWQNKAPANGRALSIDDVVFSLDRARTNKPEFVSRSALDTAQSIAATDPTTLKITTTGPDAVFLRRLASDQLLILNPETVNAAQKFATPAEAVGTGAFIVTAHQTGAGDQYVRNPDYWKAGLPYLDGVRGGVFADLATAYAAFQAGQMDIVQPPGTEVKSYLSHPNIDPATVWSPNDAAFYVHPNTKRKPFDDPRVTYALRLLIDYEEMKHAWGEFWYGRARNGFLLDAVAFAAWDLADEEYPKYLPWKQPKDDAVKQALQMLGAAGFSKANPIKFTLAFQDTGGELTAASSLMQSQWAKYSQGAVDIQLNKLDQVAINQARASKSFDMLNAGNAGAILDPDSWLTDILRSNGARNYSSFSDPTLDAKLDKERTLFDENQRKAAVRDMIIYMMDKSPLTIYSCLYIPNAITQKVHGFQPEPLVTLGRQYEHVWLDS